MAVLPEKFQKGEGSDAARILALEKYIDYLHENIEHYASVVGKRLAELEKNSEGGATNG